MLFAERERIARALNDDVIRRVFAAGLQLQGTLCMLDRPEDRLRIQSVIDELDGTIREIRAVAFALQYAVLAAEPGSGGAVPADTMLVPPEEPCWMSPSAEAGTPTPTIRLLQSAVPRRRVRRAGPTAGRGRV